MKSEIMIHITTTNFIMEIWLDKVKVRGGITNLTSHDFKMEIV